MAIFVSFPRIAKGIFIKLLVIIKFMDEFRYEVRNRHKAEDGKEEEAVNEKAIIVEKRMARPKRRIIIFMRIFSPG